MEKKVNKEEGKKEGEEQEPKEGEEKGKKEDIKTMVKEALGERLGVLEKALKAVEAKTVNVTEDGGNGKDALYEKFGKFCKGVYLRDSKMVADSFGKALNETTPSAGGYTVPEEMDAAISRAITEQYGVARKRCTIKRMNSDTLLVNKGTDTVTVSWPGEAAAVTPTNQTYSQVTMTARKMMVISEASSELIEDSNIDVGKDVQFVLARSFAKEEDNQLFNGDGSSPAITGIRNDTNINLVTMDADEGHFYDIEYDDIIDVETAIEGELPPDTAWYMSNYVWGLIRKLKDDNGQPLIAGITEKTPAGYLDGYPIVKTSLMPVAADDAVDTVFLVFGSLKEAVYFGDRRKYTLAVSTEATVNSRSAYERDLMYWKATERIEIKVVQPTMLVGLKSGSGT